MLSNLKGRTCIIYGRYSSNQQSEGYSEDRQIQKAQAFALRYGLSVDDQLSCFDRGLSGYHGHHRSKGALGALVQQVDNGAVMEGSVLLVEDTDRLSRQEPLEALNLLQQLISKGLVLITLTDEQVYDKQRLQSDIGALYVLIGKMHRAYDESRIKSERAKDVWAKKRKEAAEGGKITKRQPFWIDKSGELKPKETKLVQRIFELYVNEHQGPTAIGKMLNAEGVPTPTGRGHWYRTNIGKLLVDRAVLGYWGESKVYPAAIDRGLWARAQEAKQARTKKGGKSGFISAMRGIVTCGTCGNSVKVVKSNSPDSIVPPRTLYCRSAVEGACANKQGMSYRGAVLFSALVSAEHIAQEATKERAEDKPNTAAIISRIEDVDAKIKRLVALVRDVGGVDQATEQIKELKAEREKLSDKLIDMEAASERDTFAELSEWLYSTMPKTVTQVLQDDPKASSQLHQYFRQVDLSLVLRDGGLDCDKEGLRAKMAAAVVRVTGSRTGKITKTEDGTMQIAEGIWWLLNPGKAG